MQSWSRPKDPQDSCKLRFDWSNRLPDGETITASTIVATGTVTLSEKEIDGAYTTFRVEGGTAGEVCEITNHVTFSNDDEWDQTAKLRIRSQ